MIELWASDENFFICVRRKLIPINIIPNKNFFSDKVHILNFKKIWQHVKFFLPSYNVMIGEKDVVQQRFEVIPKFHNIYL